MGSKIFGRFLLWLAEPAALIGSMLVVLFFAAVGAFVIAMLILVAWYSMLQRLEWSNTSLYWALPLGLAVEIVICAFVWFCEQSLKKAKVTRNG